MDEEFIEDVVWFKWVDTVWFVLVNSPYWYKCYVWVKNAADADEEETKEMIVARWTRVYNNGVIMGLFPYLQSYELA